MLLTYLEVITFFFVIFLTSWDEWVPENRVLKYNEANVQKQKEVSKLHASGSAKNKKGAVGSTGNVTESTQSLYIHPNTHPSSLSFWILLTYYNLNRFFLN